ncbi:MAG: indole-3-glycerol-phosphate synthase TrpC, partial [Cytophagales bacterium]|nr:indole-3-glycerol-phosphate synthase TrpC [Cytophagales bacterium]
SELEKTLSEYIDIVGVNNRNLEDFTLDINRSKELAPLIPDRFVKISESGISQPEVIRDLKMYGFKGFLLGEAFMQTKDPIASFNSLYQRI